MFTFVDNSTTNGNNCLHVFNICCCKPHQPTVQRTKMVFECKRVSLVNNLHFVEIVVCVLLMRRIPWIMVAADDHGDDYGNAISDHVKCGNKCSSCDRQVENNVQVKPRKKKIKKVTRDQWDIKQMISDCSLAFPRFLWAMTCLLIYDTDLRLITFALLSIYLSTSFSGSFAALNIVFLGLGIPLLHSPFCSTSSHRHRSFAALFNY